MYKFIKSQTISHNISQLSLNNIAKKNALNKQMLQELSHYFASNNSKYIILESLCKNVFSSGHNLKEISEANNEEIEQVMDISWKLSLAIMKKRSIIIAEVNGLATAAGLQLASSCDVIVATKASMFGIPGMKIGLYASDPAVPLLRLLPRKIAFEMLFASRTFTAEEMLIHGLVDKVVYGESELRDESLKFCGKISEEDLENAFDMKLARINNFKC
jgi:enoyl-CoA hydratase/carnithine racemase